MWWKWALATVLTIVGGLLVLGLPGAALFTLSRPLLALVYGAGYWEKLPGDAAWPIAIGLTAVWPLGLWPFWWAVTRLFPDLTRWGKLGVYAAGLYLWAALLSLVFYHFSQK